LVASVAFFNTIYNNRRTNRLSPQLPPYFTQCMTIISVHLGSQDEAILESIYSCLLK